MARLRREEEERAYQRMLNPPPPQETFSQRFSNAAYAEVNRPIKESDLGDDDVTYNDVHRQMLLILNFMLSIAGVAATLWTLARWWSTPQRLFLTMGGSALVGIAEVALYSGYVWHLSEAKKKDKKFKEVKQVVQTWAVGAEVADATTKAVSTKEDVTAEGVRRRKKDPS
jgi:TMEM199 family protein